VLETNISSFNFITRSGNTFPCLWPHIQSRTAACTHTSWGLFYLSVQRETGRCVGRRKADDMFHSPWPAQKEQKVNGTACHQGGNKYPHIPVTPSSANLATSSNQASQTTLLALILKSPEAT